MGKGEITHYEQFLLFPQCFQRTCTAAHKNKGLFGKGLSRIDTVICNSLQIVSIWTRLNFIIRKRVTMSKTNILKGQFNNFVFSLKNIYYLYIVFSFQVLYNSPLLEMQIFTIWAFTEKFLSCCAGLKYGKLSS